MGDSEARFLLVEDEPLVARSLARLLREYGRSFIAETVAQAMPLVRGADPWAAFFIDVRLHDGSGLDALAVARQHYPTTPAIVLTGYCEPEHINRASDLGAFCALKPFKAQSIRRFAQEAARPTLRVERVVAAWTVRYRLSPAERDVLRRYALGEGRDAIAVSRASSGSTVQKHTGVSADRAPLCSRCGIEEC